MGEEKGLSTNLSSGHKRAKKLELNYRETITQQLMLGGKWDRQVRAIGEGEKHEIVTQLPWTHVGNQSGDEQICNMKHSLNIEGA